MPPLQSKSTDEYTLLGLFGRPHGCTLYDAIAKAACDNSQPGWARDYDGSRYITCASGAPQPKVEIQADVTCAKGTLVKVTRIVLYNGKPVKLVVATCG